jgi:hypothetical protein
MRTIKELEDLLDWTNNEEYQDLMRRKCVYLSGPDIDSFMDLQSLALAIYSDAKFALSCGQITLEELHSVQEHILSGLWRYPE